LIAKNALSGTNAKSAAAIAEPPSQSASALARTSAFAACTDSRPASAGSTAP
jgi:hypothetical protein